MQYHKRLPRNSQTAVRYARIHTESRNIFRYFRNFISMNGFVKNESCLIWSHTNYLPTFFSLVSQKKRQPSMTWTVRGHLNAVEIRFTKIWVCCAAYHGQITCEKYAFVQFKRKIHLVNMINVPEMCPRLIFFIIQCDFRN